MPIARIAAELETSVPTIRQRLDRLMSTGALRVVGLVDPALLGSPVVAYLHIGVESDSARVAEALRDIPEAHWVVTISDLISVIAQVSVADNETLLELAEHRVRAIPGVRSVQYEPVLRSFTSAFSFAGEVNDDEHRPLPWVAGRDRTLLIDSADREILLSLQVDGRMSFTRLAERCGLSVPATRQRFLRLRESGMVRIQSRLEPSALGLDAAASVRILARKDSTVLAEKLARRGDAAWVTQTAGEFNVGLEIVSENRDSLSAVFQSIRTLPEVLAARMHIHDQVVKSTARWSA